MQLFIKCLDGKTRTVEVERETATVETLREKVAQELNMPSGLLSPRYTLEFNGKRLDSEEMLLFEHYNIDKECTLHLKMDDQQQIYVQWCGKWLHSKTTPPSYQNFWQKLCGKNLVQSHWYKGSPMIETIANMTVWHLKKELANFLLLGESEIDVWFDNELSGPPLANDLPLDQHWSSAGRDFVARLARLSVEPRLQSRKRYRSSDNAIDDEKLIVRKVFVQCRQRLSADAKCVVDYALRCAQDCLERGEAPFMADLLHNPVSVDSESFCDNAKDAATKEAIVESWRRAADYFVIYQNTKQKVDFDSIIAEEFDKMVEYRILK